MSSSKVHRYESAQVVVTWDSARCIHAAACVHGLPQVFDPVAKPWVRPEGASPAALAEVINRCPTGALHLWHADGASADVPPATNTATVTHHGPLYLRGKLTVMVDGVAQQDSRVALCRCGASKRKPYCDGSHRGTDQTAGFADPGAIDPANPAAVAAPAEVDLGAALTISPGVNGPLQCDGPLTIKGSNGVTAFATRTFLCRCGGSQNKPWCDGSHRRVGFTT